MSVFLIFIVIFFKLVIPCGLYRREVTEGKV